MYNEEYRIKLVNLYLSSEYSIDEFLIDYNVDKKEFLKWLFKYKKDNSLSNKASFITHNSFKNIISGIIPLFAFGIFILMFNFFRILNILERNINNEIAFYVIASIAFIIIILKVIIMSNFKVIFKKKEIFKRIFGKVIVEYSKDNIVNITIQDTKYYKVLKVGITIVFNPISTLHIRKNSYGYEKVLKYREEFLEAKSEPK